MKRLEINWANNEFMEGDKVTLNKKFAEALQDIESQIKKIKETETPDIILAQCIFYNAERLYEIVKEINK